MSGGDFDQAMFEIYRRAKTEAGYTATAFLAMLQRDRGLLTARKLINATSPSAGYTALFERGRLDLTVEALVCDDDRWQHLFLPDEIDRARARLRQYQYKSRS